MDPAVFVGRDDEHRGLAGVETETHVGSASKPVPELRERRVLEEWCTGGAVSLSSYLALVHVSFQVLANLTCNAQATTSLVLKSSLLTWIEMQLLTPQENEGVAWIKIVENVLTTVDSAKLESSTNGEWRSVICRCLSLLLGDDEPGTLTGGFILTF